MNKIKEKIKKIYNKLFELNNIIKILSNIIMLTFFSQIILSMLILTYPDSYQWIFIAKVFLSISIAICFITFCIYDDYYGKKVKIIVMEKED